MSEADEETLKLTALGKIKAGVRLSTLVGELGVPYPKLLKWRKEYELAKEQGTVHTLLNADKMLIHEIAERTKQDIAELAPEEYGAISAEIDETVSGVDGLQVLSARLQSAGLKLAQKITDLSEEVDNARDANTLVNALAQLQTAFFAKGVTNNIAVLNQTGPGEETLSMFRNAMRD